MMDRHSLRLSWGRSHVELQTRNPRLRAFVAHIFQAFLADGAGDQIPPTLDQTDAERWSAVLDGREYDFCNLQDALFELEHELSEKLLAGLSDGLLLHSAAVRDNDRTIMIPGPSGISGSTATPRRWW